MSDTKNKILDSAERLIQSRGFSAISYRDISDEVGIRKASIHYYFPTKGDLAVAVVQRYREALREAMLQSVATRGNDALGMLDDYFSVYLSFQSKPEKICLCGALAGDYPVLSGETQKAIDEFFLDHEKWIKGVLELGEREGQIKLAGDAGEVASWILVSLQGALIIGRATNTPNKIKDIEALVRSNLIANGKVDEGGTTVLA